MSNQLTHYDILGVSRDASDEDIKRAYRKQLRATHPDSVQTDAAKHLFVLVQNAYEALKDASSRAKYETELSEASQSAANDAHAYSEPEAPAEPSWGQESTWDEPQNTYADPESPSPSYNTNHTPSMVLKVLDREKVRIILDPLKRLGSEQILPKKSRPVKMLIGLGLMAVVYVVLGLNAGPDMIWWVVLHAGGYLIAARRYAFKNKKFFFIALSGFPALMIFAGAQAVGNGSLAGATFLSLGAALLAGALLVKHSLIPYAPVTARNMNERDTLFPEDLIKSQKIFGTTTANSLIQGSSQADMLAEAMTAELLEIFAEAEGVRVIHGLSAPHAPNIHHAVVYGNKVALVNSAFWGEGRYVGDTRGGIIRNDRISPTWNTTLPVAIPVMENSGDEKCPISVRVWTFVHAEDDKQVLCSSASESVRLTSLYQGAQEIVAWFAESEKPIVDRKVMHRVMLFKQG